MKIGIPKEIKPQEYRVGLTPVGARILVEAGHELVVQSGAGGHVGFPDDAYESAGATLVSSAADVYACPMIVKVKEPQPDEYPLLSEGQVLFTYLHLAPDPQQTAALIDSKVVGIAYETVTDTMGRLPLLVPMSEVAGRLAVQAGANALQMESGGRGVLLGGVPGVAPASVIVLGGGVAGTEAARMAMGLGADVTVLDNNLSRLRELDAHFGPRLKTVYADPQAIDMLARAADLVIGTVLVPGSQAPKLISAETVRSMRPGSVLVDVAIDQGGCAETSRPTTHADPIYVVDGVLHYCVANMPSAAARTATQALCNATIAYVVELAREPVEKVLQGHRGLRSGLNVYRGRVANRQVAESLGYDHADTEALLKQGSL